MRGRGVAGALAGRFVYPKCGVREQPTCLVDWHRFWQCARCRTQTTLREGMLFHAPRLPLTLWFQAI